MNSAQQSLTHKGIDEELSAMPAPPMGPRIVAMTLMAAVIVLSGALLLSLRADIAYFFESPRPLNLGAVTDLATRDLQSNKYVTVDGMPMLSLSLRFGRALSSSVHEIFPLAGQRVMFVEVSADEPSKIRATSRTSFSGRLVTFGELGQRYSSVRDYFSKEMGQPVGSETFIVLADEPPGSYSWAVLVGVMCLAFITGMVILFVRWFRPLH